MRHSKRAILIATLPTVHLCLCVLLELLGGDSWNWMLIMLLDFPLLYLQKYLGDPWHLVLVTPLPLSIFGTIWWLCVGIALSFIIERFKRRRKDTFQAKNRTGE
jgi:hypothetical protein